MKVSVNRARLIQKRYELGINVKDLAEKADVAQATVLTMESGKRTPTPECLKRICEALDLKVSDVLEVVA